MPTPSIFISGAAAGIGRATALRFLDKGWLVGAFDIDADGLATLSAQVGHSNQLITGHLNVADNASWTQALALFTQHTQGQLQVLFNNAGVIQSGPLTSVTLEAQQTMLAINVSGLLAGCYLALPYLEAAARQPTHGARIINMSSASALYGQPNLAAYSASKFAVRALTEALDLEFESKGIKVMDAMPLWVKTKLVDGVEVGSIRRLGVQLAPEKIAQTIDAMVHYQGNRVHWIIGGQTKLLAFLSKVSPTRMVRWCNRILSG